ncbi:MAG: FAD-dependent oxidoreductase [Clostridiales bacterium]|nr:FAD-dependent oxidoreductase [Clostridiales bacterium]
MKEIKALRLSGIELSLDEEEAVLLQKTARILGVKPEAISEFKIIKKALDARKKERPVFVYTVDINCRHYGPLLARGRGVKLEPRPSDEVFAPLPGKEALVYPPVVVGAGPAGFFAALALAENGYNPLLFEQGRDVQSRVLDIENFWRTGVLNAESNAQFGEGGAGTFSDGKLTFRGNSVFSQRVFDELVRCGAPADILYWHKPHLGTDVLRKVMPNLRRKIISLGGRVFFDTKLEEIILKDKALCGLKIKNKGEIPAQVLVLAPGHSARDIFIMLHGKQVALASKPFAVGLRIEHSQKNINLAQYGENASHPALRTADYHLTLQRGKRGIYTFCMCPGGYVINASSESDGLVTNGMSFSPRKSGRGNSAVVVTVDESDYGAGPLAGMYWQQKIEKRAFELAGGAHALPAQRLEDFLAGRLSSPPEAAFKPLSAAVVPADLRRILPAPLADEIAAALCEWSEKFSLFEADDAWLTGVETRTSSPVRILRNSGLEAVDTSGLYPAGEGSGYAGGIISSAVDGLRSATAIISRYSRPAVDFPANILLK